MSRRPRPSREARNRDAYSRPSIVNWYSAQAGLQAGESALLAAYRSEIEGASVLDIGIGGGRTTGALLPLVGRYLGVDYSLPLVEAARVRFPQVDLRWADARELTTLGERDLDVAWFSFWVAGLGGSVKGLFLWLRRGGEGGVPGGRGGIPGGRCGGVPGLR